MAPQPNKNARGAARIKSALAGIVVLLAFAAFMFSERSALGNGLFVASLVAAVALTVLVLIPLLTGAGRDNASEALIPAMSSDREHLYMATLLENIPDKVYFKDKESRFLRVNRSFIKTYSKGENDILVGKTDFDIFTEEHARPAFDGEQRIIATGQPIINLAEEIGRYLPGRSDSGSTGGAVATGVGLGAVGGLLGGLLGGSSDT